MMTAYRFRIVLERSELRLTDRRWCRGRDRLEFARGLGHAEQSGRADLGTHLRSGLARLRAVKDGGDTHAVGRLRGGRQRLELGRLAPIVQKILDRSTLPYRNLFWRCSSAARCLDFRSSFVGKIGGLLKVEPRADRAALVIMGRMAQVSVNKAERPCVSTM